jgi:hypothetical protein
MKNREKKRRKKEKHARGEEMTSGAGEELMTRRLWFCNETKNHGQLAMCSQVTGKPVRFSNCQIGIKGRVQARCSPIEFFFCLDREGSRLLLPSSGSPLGRDV